ncbi:hypothetical protein LTR85_008915 [Meristemomyces frigidus]|nr:hypothetical protein LTR85_008915 [Meristemomyces frigidus]
MASAQVFATTELLEEILAELPCGDLLLSQRVCQEWNATIAGSKKLQQALFFLPAGPVVKAYGEDLHRYNPATTILRSVSNARWATSETSASVAVIENPLMEIIFPPHPSYEASECTRGVLYPGASWQKMLFCQPPVSELSRTDLRHPRTAYCPWDAVPLTKPVAVARFQSGVRSSDVRLVSSDGLRMADLAKKAGTTREAAKDGKVVLHVNYIWHWKRVGEAVTAASLPALLDMAA